MREVRMPCPRERMSPWKIVSPVRRLSRGVTILVTNRGRSLRRGRTKLAHLFRAHPTSSKNVLRRWQLRGRTSRIKSFQSRGDFVCEEFFGPTRWLTSLRLFLPPEFLIHKYPFIPVRMAALRWRSSSSRWGSSSSRWRSSSWWHFPHWWTACITVWWWSSISAFRSSISGTFIFVCCKTYSAHCDFIRKCLIQKDETQNFKKKYSLFYDRNC